VQEAFEQQHQHDVDAQNTGQHGQAETGKQFGHDFGVAHLLTIFTPGGRFLQGGSFLPLGHAHPGHAVTSSISKLMLRWRS
jgi:hypothetical protein